MVLFLFTSRWFAVLPAAVSDAIYLYDDFESTLVATHRLLTNNLKKKYLVEFCKLIKEIVFFF